MKILMIGCVESSEYFLRVLMEHHKNICGVITKNASNFNSDFVDLTPICKKNSIPCICYTPQADAEMHDFARQCEADIAYCFGWSHLLKEDFISIFPLGVVGFHPAQLPHNRGRHPLIWALVLGLKQTASSFFMIDSGADSGTIISQKPISINDNDTARTLYDKILKVAGAQIIEFTDDFESQNIKPIQQNDVQANYWRKRTKKDGLIDFRMSADTIHNLVRALSRPYIGAHFEFYGNEYKVWETEVIKQTEVHQNMEFGKIIEVYSPVSFLVKTGHELLKVLDCDPINLTQEDYL